MAKPRVLISREVQGNHETAFIQSHFGLARGGINRNVNVNNVNLHRNVVYNAVYGHGTAWGWNRGVAWYPAAGLQNYRLVKVQCGPPGLVVVYGPQNSVICTNPNLVAAGSYSLNTETLSLTPM